MWFFWIVGGPLPQGPSLGGQNRENGYRRGALLLETVSRFCVGLVGYLSRWLDATRLT